MSRNAMNVFNQVPSIDIQRSRFDRSHKVAFTCNASKLIPFMVEPVLPGDTFEVKTTKLIRMQTLLHPLMDDLYADFYYFYVKNIDIWTHWREFCGEANPNAWIQNPTYTIPKVRVYINPERLPIGSVVDYMGLPVGSQISGSSGNITVNALPFRALAFIWNEFFRDENLQDPINISMGDATVTLESMFETDPGITNYGCPPVCKYRDYFTSSLPGVQKGPAVNVFGFDFLPVYPDSTEAANLLYGSDPMRFSVDGATKYAAGLSSGSPANMYLVDEISGDMKAAVPNNLVVPLSLYGQAALNVNDLRMAFAVQRFYEAMARGGSRYVEILNNLFHVRTPDSKLYRPEYLGGNRVRLNINSVVNQSQTEGNPLGDLGAYSVTADKHHDFIFSAQQHGWIIGVMCIRYDHTYAQGAERFWFDSDRFDLYWPQLANLGEQPIYNGEIYFTGTDADKQAFGFQEAWASYRWKPNSVRGEMRPGVPNTLASWTLADYYAETPRLSAGWIKEDLAPIDRAISVTSAAAHQFLVDMKIEARVTRPMPLYSVPGLIDHH